MFNQEKKDQVPVPRWMKDAKARGQAIQDTAQEIREQTEDLRRNGIRKSDRRTGISSRTATRG